MIIMNLGYIFAPIVLFVFERQSKKSHFLYISSDVIDGLTPFQLNKKYRKIEQTAFGVSHKT